MLFILCIWHSLSILDTKRFQYACSVFRTYISLYDVCSENPFRNWYSNVSVILSKFWKKNHDNLNFLVDEIFCIKCQNCKNSFWILWILWNFFGLYPYWLRSFHGSTTFPSCAAEIHCRFPVFWRKLKLFMHDIQKISQSWVLELHVANGVLNLCVHSIQVSVLNSITKMGDYSTCFYESEKSSIELVSVLNINENCTPSNSSDCKAYTY